MPVLLTQEKMKSVIRYNPDTGIFIWLVGNNKRKAGDIAGGIGAAGYWMIGVSGKRYYAHMLAWLYMTGEFPTVGIDHKDRCKTNNKWDNLRLATKAQNSANTEIMSTNKSGYKGVSWHRDLYKWQVHIRINGKSKYLGVYTSKEEAAQVYRNAAIREHGEFVNMHT